MNHDEIQGLLEGYVDETLDRETRKAVDEHLAGCEECQAILDHVHPVDLSPLAPTAFDERTMRRMVRRSIFRTAVDAALLVIVGAVVMALLSAVLFQPLVINRGGRAADAFRATVDATTLINPGVVVTGIQVTPGVFHRNISIEVTLPVGSGSHELGPVEARIGALSLSRADGAPPWGFIGPEGFGGGALDQLSQLGPGTVATVAVTYDDPITIGDAQQIADGTAHDMRVVWAGFDITGPEVVTAPWPAGGVVGYSTCVDESEIPDYVFGSSSSGFGRSLNSAPASIAGALSMARAGLANIAENTDLIETAANLGFSGTNLLADAIDRLNGPDAEVRMLVLTGPSIELVGYLGDTSTQSSTAQVLAVDFYNWSTPVCGR